MNGKGILLVLSGPSGAGKGTLCRALLEKEPSMQLSISATTRLPRGDEQDGVHYHFTTRDVFQEMIQNDQLLEWAEVYGNYYGTPRRAVYEVLAQGRDVILEIDIQGALQVKEKIESAVLVFVAPPSPAELRRRLVGRATDSLEEIEKRLSCTAKEMKLARRYNYVVINDEVERAVARLQSIVQAEKCRPRYFENFFDQFSRQDFYR
ncbi:MAG: guanylate kinase [Firmicutes bacterium]|nr:guanylate kinase [Bacillota bacterium]